MKTRDQQFVDPERGPVLSARFAVALVLIALGIAWIVYYYVGVRPDPTGFTKDGGRVTESVSVTMRAICSAPSFGSCVSCAESILSAARAS